MYNYSFVKNFGRIQFIIDSILYRRKALCISLKFVSILLILTIDVLKCRITLDA